MGCDPLDVFAAALSNVHLALAGGWLAFISSLDAFFDVFSLCASHTGSSLTATGQCSSSARPQQVIVDAIVTELR
jgi:hypothetical protein